MLTAQMILSPLVMPSPRMMLASLAIFAPHPHRETDSPYDIFSHHNTEFEQKLSEIYL